MKTVRRILSASWGQIVAALVLLLSLRFYSQWLGPESFGLAMLGLGAVSLLDGLGSMAFAQTLAQLLKDREQRSQRLALAFGLGLRFALWNYAIYAAGLVLAVVWFGLQAGVWLLPVVLVFCLTEIPRAAGLTLAMLERRLGLLSVWNALDAIGAVLASLGFLALTDSHPVALVLGALAGRILTCAVMAPVALGSPRNWAIDLAGARNAYSRALGFGWALAVMAPLGWLGAFADRYIVGANAGLAAAGVLAALAGAVMRPYGVISGGLTNIFRPDLLDAAAGRAPVQRRPLARWLGLAAAIGLCGILGFAVLGQIVADFLLRFATPDIDRGQIMVVLAASQMFVLMTHAFDNQLLAHGRSRLLLASQLAALAVGLPLVGWGAAVAGANGAAWGRLAAELARLAGAAALVGYLQSSSLRRTEAGTP